MGSTYLWGSGDFRLFLTLPGWQDENMKQVRIALVGDYSPEIPDTSLQRRRHPAPQARLALTDLLFACIIGLACGGCVGSGDVQVPLPLLPAALVAWDLHGDKEIAHLGAPLDRGNTDGFMNGVSDHFGTNDLRQIYDLLNSAAFRATLTNYSCGDPVPAFAFNLTLYRQAGVKTNALSVEWRYSPRLDEHDRGLDCGLMYSVHKAFASIEAARRPGAYFERVVREPHIDCSKRPAHGQHVESFSAGGPKDWVTYPGPDEVLW
jgi:hypothetical protein